MSNGSKVPGCFKYGCIGCLSIVAILVGLTFLLGAIHVSSDSVEPDPQRREVQYDLPPSPQPALQPPRPTNPPPLYPGSDTVAMPEVNPLPEAPPFPPAKGKVIFDVSMTELTIRPGPADEPIRIEADYDQGSFELEEDFTTSDNGSWSYEISFGGHRGVLGTLLSGNDPHNRIELIIPRGHPIDIIGEIGMGETEADFGGLWIGTLDLDLGAGDHFIEFREPLTQPMNRLELRSSVGSVELREVGNASPAVVDVDHTVGELLLDLEGPWRTNAIVDVSFGVGECRLWLPDEARVKLERSSIGIGERRVDSRDEDDLPADAPVLTVAVRGRVGEVTIE